MSTVSLLWQDAIAAWLTWCAIEHDHSEQTRYTRRQQLQRVARTLGIADPWQVDAVTLERWFRRQDWRTETRRANRTTLVGFYRWGVAEGHVEVSPARLLPRVKPAAPNPQPAPDSAYLPALAAADDRERLMLRLAAQHGMRRAEIAVVHTRRDLLEDLAGWSLIVHGKGGKERIVPLLDDVAADLRELPVGWAFPGAVDGHISPRWTGKLVNRLLPDAWTIHKLRHRAATQWWNASDHDLFVVQELLGHASPATTRLYVPVAQERMRRAVNIAARMSQLEPEGQPLRDPGGAAAA